MAVLPRVLRRAEGGPAEVTAEGVRGNENAGLVRKDQRATGRRDPRRADRRRPRVADRRRCGDFDWDVRRSDLVDHDTHWEDWSRIHRLARSKGLRTPATMLYGHIEEPRHRVDHVLRLRGLQDETGGFVVFIPLVPQRQQPTVPPADGATGGCAAPLRRQQAAARQLRSRQGVLGNAPGCQPPSWP